MFCPHCGKQISDAAKFCPECGSATGLREKASTSGPSVSKVQASASSKIDDTDLQNAEYAVLGAGITMGVAALLALLLFQAALLFVIDAAIAAAIFWLVYKNLKDKKLEMAKVASLGTGIACGLLALLALFTINILGMIIAGGCAAALLYAFTELRS